MKGNTSVRSELDQRRLTNGQNNREDIKIPKLRREWLCLGRLLWKSSRMTSPAVEPPITDYHQKEMIARRGFNEKQASFPQLSNEIKLGECQILQATVISGSLKKKKKSE